jgi:hypothetical protein
MRTRLGLLVAVLLINAPASAQIGSHRSPAEMARLEAAKTRIEGALARHRSLPQVKSLYEAFNGKIRVTKFVTNVPGGEGTVYFSTTRPAPMPDALEIALVSPEHLNHPRIGGNKLYYNGAWQVIFCVDTAFADDGWFDALLLHEMVHVLRDRNGDPSARTTMLSDLWIAEEIEAHDLERAVLNHATNGAYARTLMALVQSAPKARDGSPVVLPEHYEALESLFKRAHPSERSLHKAQEFYDIHATWIEHNFSIMEWQRLKTIAYRLVSRQ